MIDRIVTGGQTGVDQAALEVGLALGLSVTGFCPAGFRAENGQIPERFRPYLTCTRERGYRARTLRNLELGDGTLILARSGLTGGTALAERTCREAAIPCLVVSPDDATAIDAVRAWVERHGLCALNVAGPRESTDPGIGQATRDFLDQLLGGRD